MNNTFGGTLTDLSSICIQDCIQTSQFTIALTSTMFEKMAKVLGVPSLHAPVFDLKTFSVVQSRTVIIYTHLSDSLTIDRDVWMGMHLLN